MPHSFFSNTSTPKQAIVNGSVTLYVALNLRVLAECIETKLERNFPRDACINLM